MKSYSEADLLFHDLEMIHAAIYDNRSAIVHQEPSLLYNLKGWMLNVNDMVGPIL